MLAAPGQVQEVGRGDGPDEIWHRCAAQHKGRCDPSYPDVCIPPPPPDLDCADIPYRNFRVLWDVPDPDPHHFDGDHDGVGCES